MAKRKKASKYKSEENYREETRLNEVRHAR
jgi:hypothetical protein